MKTGVYLSSLFEEVQRQQFKLILSKVIEQDPLFIATMIKRFPKIYRYKFITIETFERVPDHFYPVYNAIKLLGPNVDGSEYGIYSLTLHGRGKKYGQTDSEKARYFGGCKLVYSPSKEKPIQVKEVKSNINVFIKLLKTVDDVNALILKEKVR